MLFTNNDKNRLPNIVELRYMLLEEIQKFPVLHRKPFEQEQLDRDKFVVTPLASRRFSLKPNITQQGVLFHGSHQLYDRFTPRLYQCDNTDYLRENVLQETLRITMESHPLYYLLKKGIILSNDVFFSVYNPYGMAACYGFNTPFIQLTSDLDTAIMYAITAESHDGRRCYLNSRDSDIGVLYIFELYNTFGMIKGLSTLGLQAFERPGRMKEFLYQMDSKSNFNEFKFVKGFTFRHDIEAERNLLATIRRPRITDGLSVKVSSWLNPGADGKITLPIEALRRNTIFNRLNKLEEKTNREYLETENIHFIDQGDAFRFTENELSSIDLRAKWYRLSSQLTPMIYPDRRIIDGLMRVPDDPRYRQYFDYNLWLERKINN